MKGLYVFIFLLLCIGCTPKYAEHYLEGKKLYILREHKEAINEFNKAINIRSDDPDAFLFRGDSKLSVGDYSGSIEDFNRVINLETSNKDKAKAYNARGKAHEFKKDFTSAVKDYNTSIRLYPKYAEPYFNKGIINYLKQDYQRAIKDFSLAIRFDANFSHAYYNRALAKYLTQDYQGAIADCYKAFKYDNTSYKSYYLSGYIRMSLKDYSGAIKDFRHALYINPDFTIVYLYRANCYYQLGKYRKACRDWKEAREGGLMEAIVNESKYCQ